MKTHAFWRGRKTGEVTAAGPIDGAAAGRAVPAAPALRRDEGGEMATSEVTWESLREFAAFRAESPRALSVYIGLDPRTAATAGDPASRLSALLASGKHLAADEALDEFERAAVRTDIERVATFFAGELEREGVRGVAVFASSLDDVFEPVAVNGLVPDEIRLDNVFHLAPLVPLAEAEQALVAVVGREQGTRRPAFQCPACGRVAAREGACPQDGEALRRHDDGAGLAAHRTLLRGGTILTVIEHRDLEPAGGIAALLRY